MRSCPFAHCCAHVTAAESDGLQQGIATGRQQARNAVLDTLHELATDYPCDTLSPITMSLRAPGSPREHAELAYRVALAGITTEIRCRFERGEM